MTGDEKVKKSRDPIFTACLVIFMVAVVAILGGFVNDHYIQKDNTKAAYGDEVEVSYTGSFYAYVGEDKAVVFDTSNSSIGNNDDISKANSFTKTSYSNLTFTIGNGTMLQGFEEAVVGHKVGDKIYVIIPAGEGYNGPQYTGSKTNATEELSVTMPKTAFSELYEDVTLVSGVAVTFTTVYGWEATAMYSGNDVVIYNMPEVGKTYEYIGNEDSEYGDVKFKVTSVDDQIHFEYIFENYVPVGNNGDIQMIEIDFGTETWYVSNISGDSFTYKTSEKDNIDLYFEIVLESIN
ncbi:MAG: FKBP-type peptidyl-prolyl cis-trans isomerase [Candidatus Methanomethylophilaceae archaeon]